MQLKSKKQFVTRKRNGPVGLGITFSRNARGLNSRNLSCQVQDFIEILTSTHSIRAILLESLVNRLKTICYHCTLLSAHSILDTPDRLRAQHGRCG